MALLAEMGPVYYSQLDPVVKVVPVKFLSSLQNRFCALEKKNDERNFTKAVFILYPFYVVYLPALAAG